MPSFYNNPCAVIYPTLPFHLVLLKQIDCIEGNYCLDTPYALIKERYKTKYRALIKAHGLGICPGGCEHDSRSTLRGYKRKLEPKGPLIAFENPT